MLGRSYLSHLKMKETRQHRKALVVKMAKVLCAVV